MQVTLVHFCVGGAAGANVNVVIFTVFRAIRVRITVTRKSHTALCLSPSLMHLKLTSFFIWVAVYEFFYISVILGFLLTVLTPCSRLLLEKLTGSQLAKNFPTHYGTWRFITPFTSAWHLTLSWARSIQPVPPLVLPEEPSYIKTT